MIEHYPAQFSRAELVAVLGNEIAVDDGVVRLPRAGLVHRRVGFVFPTRGPVRPREFGRGPPQSS